MILGIVCIGCEIKYEIIIFSYINRKLKDGKK